MLRVVFWPSARSASASLSLLDLVRQLGDLVVDGAPFSHQLADLAVGVDAVSYTHLTLPTILLV